MSTSTLAHGEPDADELPAVAWSIPTADFRTRQAWLSLSPSQRAAVRARRRFWSIPYIRPAGEADPDDDLPF